MDTQMEKLSYQTVQLTDTPTDTLTGMPTATLTVLFRRTVQSQTVQSTTATRTAHQTDMFHRKATFYSEVICRQKYFR